MGSITPHPPAAAAAWDGHVVTAIADQVVRAFATGTATPITSKNPPALCG